jgi:hypothetical protein
MPYNIEFHLPPFPTSSSPQTGSRDISSSLMPSTARTYAMRPFSSEASPSASLFVPSIAELERKQLIQRATGAAIRGQVLGLPIPALSSSRKQYRKYPLWHIPRPPNCFFCFRRRFAAEVMAIDKRPRTGKAMSELAGEAWRALSNEEKAPWEAEAQGIKEEHLIANPGYKYQPKTGEKGKNERTASRIEPSIAASSLRSRGKIAAQATYVPRDAMASGSVDLSPLGLFSALPAISTVGALTSLHGTESFSEQETHSYELTSGHSPVSEREISSGWETSSFASSFSASLSPLGAGYSELGFIPFPSRATPLVLPSPPTSPPPPMLPSALLWTPDDYTAGSSLGSQPYATHPSVLPEGVSQVANVSLGSWALPMYPNNLIFPPCPPASSFSDAHSGDFLALEQLFPADTFYDGVAQLETPPDSTHIVPRALQSEDPWSETMYDHTASTSSWLAALP